MSRRMDRRQFVLTGAAAAGLGTIARDAVQASGQGPTMLTPKSVKPVVIASSNGNQYKNGGPMAGVETAFKLMMKGDDVLDALIASVNLCELDPEDTSVGYGGLPNADGVVQLIRAACTDRRSARAASHASKACARRRSSRAW